MSECKILSSHCVLELNPVLGSPTLALGINKVKQGEIAIWLFLKIILSTTRSMERSLGDL